jgi:hypothetical protein
MKEYKGVIEFICEGGFGSEANVKLELRTEFAGIGGTIITYEGVATALREEYTKTPRSGHKMFLRHAIIKKLEDYFYRTGAYMFAHIPRPLGSISKDSKNPYEAYIYEWAFGSEGFPWERVDSEGNLSPIRLNDWDNFVKNFNLAGINMELDCTDPMDGRISQNIIHQYPTPIKDGLEMSMLWKRIDFGPRSLNIDYDKLLNFINDKRKDLIDKLRNERFEMLLLAVEYLTKGTKMNDLDIGRLDALIGEYRRSSLRHYISKDLGATEPTPLHYNTRTESLI